MACRYPKIACYFSKKSNIWLTIITSRLKRGSTQEMQAITEAPKLPLSAPDKHPLMDVVGCLQTHKEKLTWARARAEKGVSSAGFTTTVQPAARAAPTFRVIMALGKFHWDWKSKGSMWEEGCLIMQSKAGRGSVNKVHCTTDWQTSSLVAQVSSQNTWPLRDLGDKGS